MVVKEEMVVTEKRKKAFISFSSKDRVISRLIYNYLKNKLPYVDFFFSDQTMPEIEDFYQIYIRECNTTDMGIIILTDNSLESPKVKEEIEILSKRDVPRYYIQLQPDLNQKLGSDKRLEVCKLDTYKDPYVQFNQIAQKIKKKLSIDLALSQEKKYMFERKYFGECYSVSLKRRDACRLLNSLKCADSKIKIMGENALKAIHGGFEDLKNLIQAGGHVQILLINYDSEKYKEREEIEGATITKRLRADWIASMGNILQLYQFNYHSICRPKNGTIEVKLTDEGINGSIVIIDNWELQYNKYNQRRIHEGNREFDSQVHLYLNKGECSDEYQRYYEEFEAIWNDETSKTLELDKINMSNVVPENFFSDKIVV